MEHSNMATIILCWQKFYIDNQKPNLAFKNKPPPQKNTLKEFNFFCFKKIINICILKNSQFKQC